MEDWMRHGRLMANLQISFLKLDQKLVVSRGLFALV